MLDEDLHAKILHYVSEHKASLSCKTWKDFLYTSLQLEQRIWFYQQLSKGPVTFSYNAVRPLGEDFEESVSYQFEFAANGTYNMQWARTFDAWSSQSEQHFGKWNIDMGRIDCETLEPTDANDREVRYAPAGYAFSVDIEDIVKAKGSYFQETLGAAPKIWELPARTGKIGDDSPTHQPGLWEPVEAGAATPAMAPVPLRANARFVEIDGEMHEVSGDIVQNCSESDWAKLMKLRLRFGING